MNENKIEKENKSLDTQKSDPLSKINETGAASPYLFISSFSDLVKRQPIKKRVDPIIPKPIQETKPKNPKLSKFLVELPPPFHIRDDDGEEWTLACVCNDHDDTGFLVQCEECGVWQHGICFNLNSHTTPEHYLCEVCGCRPIRCSCEENLNYRYSLIKCSRCGYYVHKRCAGFFYGPMPTGSFVCSTCGQGLSKFSYPKLRLQNNQIYSKYDTFTFTEENMTRKLEKRALTGPFHDFLMIDEFESTLTAKEFFEDLFDRFRSFYFLCHPLFSTSVQKRRVQNLVTNVVNASEYLCAALYGIKHSDFVSMMNELLVSTIYKNPEFVDDPDEVGLTFSENGRNYNTLYPPQYLAQMPEEVKLRQKDGGIICNEDLSQGQFLMCVDGFLCDIEELNYDDKVNGAYYQIKDSRLVLDATRFRNSPLHKFKHSMYGNCVLKLFVVDEKIMCGLFIGRAQLTPYDHTQILTVKAGEELTLGIDFLPAVCEDFTKWLSWHFGSLDTLDLSTQRPTPEQREVALALRASSEKTTKKKKYKKNDDDDEKKKKNKAKKKKIEMVQSISEPYTLFELFEADDPGPLLFYVGDNLDQIDIEAKIRVAAPTQGHRGRPRIHPKTQTPKHTTGKRKPGRPSKKHNDDDYNDDEIKNRHTKEHSKHSKKEEEAEDSDEKEEEQEAETEPENKEEEDFETKSKQKEETDKYSETPIKKKETKDEKEEEKVEKVEKTEEKKRKEPIVIFSSIYQKEVDTFSKKIMYNPVRISNPKNQILDILGM